MQGRFLLCVVVILAVLLQCGVNAQALAPITFSYTGTVQTWNVPGYVRTVRITAAGAPGAMGTQNDNNFRGKAMTVAGTFDVRAISQLSILVGEMPAVTSVKGGGGSFVWNTASNTVPLIAAGGGGASGGGSCKEARCVGADASSSTCGSATNHGEAGGCNGADGSASEGGAGWNYLRANSYIVRKGTSGTIGGGGPTSSAGGGGGGYSGGGGCTGSSGGGGGGSYNSGTAQAFALASGWTEASVTITILDGCMNGNTTADNNFCVCFSGYTGDYCQNAANNTACPPKVADSKESSLLPALTNSSYENNQLTLTLTAPYIAGRQYTNLTFTSATSKLCTRFGATGHYWTSTFNNCSDVLSVKVPWSASRTCGFRNISDSDNSVVYASQVRIEYTEPLNNMLAGMTVSRKMYHEINVFVSFPKTLTLQLVSMNVTSPVGVDIALTREHFNPVTKELTLELTTSLGYPSMLLPGVNATTPASINLVGGAVSVIDTACAITAGTGCLQKIIYKVTMTNNQTCTFDGVYTASGTIVACRDADKSTCERAPLTVRFEVLSGSVCASVDLHPKATGNLLAYSTSNFAGPEAAGFKIGEQVFLYAKINAGQGNTPAVRFANISYTLNNGASEYLLQNYLLTSKGTSATVALKPESNYFSLFLSGSVFQGSFGSEMTLTFTALVEVDFGGKKRMVEVEWATEGDEDHHYITAQKKVHVVTKSVAHTHPNPAVAHKPESSDKESVAAAPTVNSFSSFLQSRANLTVLVGGFFIVGCVFFAVAVFAIVVKRVMMREQQGYQMIEAAN